MNQETLILIGMRQDFTDNPITPNPKIATVEPSSTSAVFHAAPTPERRVQVFKMALLKQCASESK